MKKLFFTFVVILAQMAWADSSSMIGNKKDASIKALVQMLKGHTLKCNSKSSAGAAAENFGKGFFPFKVKATSINKKGDVKVEISCQGAVSFGAPDLTYSYAQGWLMFEASDDGSQSAFIRAMDSYDASSKCSEMRPGVSSEIQGVVLSEWSNIIQSTEQITCCYE